MPSKDQSAWLSLNPGDLRHQISIVQPGTTGDSFNQPVPTSQTLIRATAAAINLVSMREAFGLNQLTSQATDVWTVRWSPITLKPGMLVLYGTRTFNIQALNNVSERNLVLHLLCQEINAPSQ